MPEIKIPIKWKLLKSPLYLKTDPYQYARQFTDINVGPDKSIRYGLKLGSDEPTYHHVDEISDVEDLLTKQKTENMESGDDDSDEE